MLISILYNVGVFGLTVSHFQSFERLKDAHARRKQQLLHRAFSKAAAMSRRSNSFPELYYYSSQQQKQQQEDAKQKQQSQQQSSQLQLPPSKSLQQSSSCQQDLNLQSTDNNNQQLTKKQRIAKRNEIRNAATVTLVTRVDVAAVAAAAMRDLRQLHAPHPEIAAYNMASPGYALLRRENFNNRPSLLSRLITYLLASHTIVDSLRVWLLHHLLLFSLLAQIAILFLMSAVIGVGFAYRAYLYIIVVLLLACQLFLVASVSLKLVSKINSNELTLTFLASSYFSTILAFASLYLLIFIASPTHEFSINVTELSNVQDSHSFNYVLQVLGVFLYFSCTAQSGTGFGDIYARGVIGRIVVSVQMLASITYGVIIVGCGISIIIQRQDRVARSQFKNIVLEAARIQEEEEEEEEEAEEHQAEAQKHNSSLIKNNEAQRSSHSRLIDLYNGNHAMPHDTDDEKQPLSPPPQTNRNNDKQNLSLHPLWRSNAASSSSNPSTPQQPLSASERRQNGSQSGYGSSICTLTTIRPITPRA
jgi:hypothetical protein